MPRRRGRPPTGHDPVSAIRLSPMLKSKIDNWANEQDDQPSRSAAIRRLLTLALSGGKKIEEDAHAPRVSDGTKNDTRYLVGVRRLTGFQIRAARAVLGWSAEDLARQSSVSLRTIRRTEVTNVRTKMKAANEQAIRRALEGAGVDFIDENGGGPGVRLRKRLSKKRATSSDAQLE